MGVNRANYYYQPIPPSSRELEMIHKIDAVYTKFPYYGSPKITEELREQQRINVNHKMIERLMSTMGLQAVVPKRNFSKPNVRNAKYPYLLKNLPIIKSNQVWGTDITFIRAHGIWFYLVAIMDWFSRYVLAWKLSTTIQVNFCLDALRAALKIAVPEIHNSDQGSQFTSIEYIQILQENNIQISMDSRGRCFDNIFTERLWRSVKYEEVYLHEYTSFAEAENSLNNYFQVYNHKRIHQALNYQIPAQVYFQN